MEDWHRRSGSTRRIYQGKHRFEHWLRDKQVYFITARVRGRFPAFASEEAKWIWWEAFEHYAASAASSPGLRRCWTTTTTRWVSYAGARTCRG